MPRTTERWTPAPGRVHQAALVALFARLGPFLRSWSHGGRLAILDDAGVFATGPDGTGGGLCQAGTWSQISWAPEPGGMILALGTRGIALLDPDRTTAITLVASAGAGGRDPAWGPAIRP